MTNIEESSLTRCNILLIKANRSYLKLEKMESEKLVTVIVEFPALYDITLKAYHNKVETEKCWETVALQMNKTGE